MNTRIIMMAVILLFPPASYAVPVNMDALYGHLYKASKDETLLKHHAPDLLRTLPINGKSYTFLSYQTARLRGVTYIEAPSHAVYKLDIGPVFSVLSSFEAPFLHDNEVLITTVSGGSDIHTIYGFILSMNDEIKAVASFPLSGVTRTGKLNFPPDIREKADADAGVDVNYSVTATQIEGNALQLEGVYRTHIHGLSQNDTARVLQSLELPSVEEHFTVHINPNRKVSIARSAKGVGIDEYIVDFYKDKNLVTLLNP